MVMVLPDKTLGGSETLQFKKGSNINLSESGGVISISATDNNTWIANSSTTAGYVQSGVGQANKVWKTNASGVPAWRDDADTNTDTTYTTATSSVLGLVKIGYTESGKNYPVELSSGKMFVNVPWVDTNTDTNTTYVSSDFTHDDLTGFVANEHIDWTTDQGATNIHANNYTNTNTNQLTSFSSRRLR